MQLICLINGQSDTQVTSTAQSKKAAGMLVGFQLGKIRWGEGLCSLQREPLSPSGKRERRVLCK